MRKFQKGTPECGLLCGAIGVVLALMILFLGFWRTVFVALLFAVGYFMGAVKDKGQAIKNAINRIFPAKDQ